MGNYDIVIVIDGERFIFHQTPGSFSIMDAVNALEDMYDVKATHEKRGSESSHRPHQKRSQRPHQKRLEYPPYSTG